MTRVYCVVGYPGAGKSAAADIASDRGIPSVTMGNMVRERATEELGPDATSNEIGEWATEQREQHGDTIVAHWTADYISELSAPVVVIDGVRSLDELSQFKQAFDDVTVLHIHAPKETRLQRLRDRGRDGEDTFTMADLDARDTREDDWGVATLLETVNPKTIVNDSDLDDFAQQLDFSTE